MEISLLKVLLNNMSSFLQILICDDKYSEPVEKYYRSAGDTLKLLKTILDAIVNTDLVLDDVLSKAFEELGHLVGDLKVLFKNWQPLSSKVYFVLQFDSLLSKVQTSGLDIFEYLKLSHLDLPDELNSASIEHCVQKFKQIGRERMSSGLDIFEYLKLSHLDLPDELNSASIEHCVQKFKHIGCERMSSVIKEALRDQVEGVGPSSELLVKIAENLHLKSNQEILIEAVALEKVKENAEQTENTEEAEYVDDLITLVTRMHDRLAMIKQSQSCSPVPIPTDFCCPLSLELMTDPVIVASGQTYERAHIREWLDLGLTMCPKTRKTLAHTNLIPNYTVKALIANWCELNNVKLPDPVKPSSFSQPLHPLTHADSYTAKDTHNRSHSIGNHLILPESGQSISSPRRNTLISSGHHREGSPIHPHSTSESSFSGAVESGECLDLRKMSLSSSEDGSANIGERTQNLVAGSSTSPSGVDQQLTPRHDRTVSDSSSVTRLGEKNEALRASSHLRANSSGPSVLEKSGPQTATVANPRVESELPSRVEPRGRNQSIWRRPSDRFAPRIVSTPAAETRADLSGVEAQVRNLVENLKSTSIETQREATAELRLLARNNMDNRIVIGSSGAIAVLVDLLRSADTETQENAVTALLNLSINDNNKTAIGNADAIEPLIHVLETGSPEAKENAAATLFSLSVVEDNKIKIGRSGAIRPLVELLGNGTPRGKKDAATALFNLSIHHENKARIVQAGAVKHLVDLMDPAAGMVDKAVAVLANLATIPDGRTMIGQEGGIPVLVEVVELGSPRGKENAAAALLQLCTTSSRYCHMVLQEGAVPPLVALSQSGTPRAREKAQALLSCFRNQRHGNAGRG